MTARPGVGWAADVPPPVADVPPPVVGDPPPVVGDPRPVGRTGKLSIGSVPRTTTNGETSNE
jgi:hypothetical protein